MKIFFLFEWRAYVAEFIGTYVFVLIASGSYLLDMLYGNVDSIGVAFATGLTISAMVFATMHISGGHLNPVITLSLWLSKKVSTVTAVFYILAQILASFIAAGTLLVVFGQNGMKFFLGTPLLGPNITAQGAVILETILTMILVFCVYATMVDKKGPLSFSPIAVGLVIVALSVFGGGLTGAVMNPARVLGPAILSGQYNNLAIWIIGPAAGSLMGVLYQFVFIYKPKK